MTVGRRSALCPLTCIAAALCALIAFPCVAEDAVSALFGLTLHYGDRHFDPARSVVTDEGGTPDLPLYSLPYALALLETGGDAARARVLIESTLAVQDTQTGSPTRGLFRAAPGAAPGRTATAHVIPLLVIAYSDRSAILGEECCGHIKAALELALKALERPDPASRDNDVAEWLRYAAILQAARALNDPAIEALTLQSLTAVSQWLRTISTEGRTWAPSPDTDGWRLIGLQRLWSAVPQAQRAELDQALRVCYLDFAQRVQPAVPILGGAASHAGSDWAIGGDGIAQYLIARDFGLKAPEYATPLAAVVALCEYRPPADIVARVRPDFKPYMLETNSSHADAPAQTVTYVQEDYTLGTMSGWCWPDSIPTYVTFAHYEEQPTAYVRVHGAPAHVNSFQYSNLALCSLNFDHIGIGEREQAWVKVYLGSVREIEEVYALGTIWHGDAIAVGSRGTIVVKRGNAYLAVTVLECGPVDADVTSRRKPGALEWEGTGEHAWLTLTIYARQEDYALPRAQDDWRAGYVIQVWNGDQFDSTQNAARWLDTARVVQQYAPAVLKTPVAQDLNPVLDRNKPQPKPKYLTTAQKVHTIEYSYRRGEGNRFKLVEDLRRETVMSRTVNDVAVGKGQWWQSPALNWLPKQKLEAALTAAAQPETP
jgi:hypothetical protein